MQIRDWLHVEDHCLGVALVLEGDAIGESFNIGGGAELTNLTVIETLCAAVDDAFARDPALAARFPDATSARCRPSSELNTYVSARPGHYHRDTLVDRHIASRRVFQPHRHFSPQPETHRDRQ